MATPTILESADFHPQIDPPLSESARASLLSQIHAERPSDYTSKQHRQVNTNYTPSFPPSLHTQHDTLNAGLPLSTNPGIDLSRYEQDALAPPPTMSDADDAATAQQRLADWQRTTLRAAQASATYLQGRTTSLALLETYGKNAWLVSNWQLEAELAALDAEMTAARAEAELLADERRARAEAGAAEFVVLEERWRKGIGGLVEVQVATEGVRREILERKREIAAG